MNDEIRVLILEDVPADAELMERELRRAGVVFTSKRVDTKEALARELENFKPGVILADYKLPAYDGRSAVQLVRQKHPEVPVIMVTGTLGDEAAVELLKAGARDYVLKDGLARLGPAVRRALSEEQGIRDRKRAEQSVKESEARFRALVETTSDWIWEVDEAGVYTYCSPKAMDILGYAPEELIGKLPFDFMPADEASRVGKLFAEFVAAKEPFAVLENANLHRDGRRVVLETSGVPVLNAKGDLLGYRGVDRDITERKHAEEQIVRLNRLYATLSGINMSIVRAASPAELFDRVCEVAVEHGRFSMAWIGTVDRADQMVTPVAQRGLSPEDMLALRDSVGRIAEGRGRTATSIREDRTIYTNDYEVERASTPWHAQAAKQGIRGSATLPIKQGGEIVGVLKLYVRERDFFDAEQVALLEEMRTDISFAMNRFDTEAKRTQAETALLESEEKLRTISFSAQDAIVMVDNNGRIEFWNQSAARLFGYTADETTGKPLHELIVPERLRDKAQSGFEQFKATGQGPIIGKILELPSLRKDGTEFVAEHSISAVKLKGMWHAVAMVRDITERKEAEKKRQHDAERLRRSLEETIRAIALTVEMRDPYTAGHQLRVAELSVAVARELGLHEEQIHGLRLAGTIHDLGKIHIPAEILSKPGKLTDIEFSFIKTHPRTGHDILKNVEFPWPIAQIVLQHHERLDGTGYPQGLKAEQILIEARILAVADVVEAMASHRPYRAAVGIGLALQEIERGAGSAYDPPVAAACLKLFHEGRFAFQG